MRIPKSIAIILIVIGVLLLVAIGALVGINIMGARGGAGSQSGLSPYSAVYLSTGDIYFGTLDWSPSPHLENAWLLQRGTDAKGDPTTGVTPFDKAVWGPSDTIYFNASQIVFWTRLASDSSVAQAIANPSLIQSAPSAEGTSSILQ